MELSRRQFLLAAIGAGAVAVVPPEFMARAAAPPLGPAPEPGYFLTPARWSTCQAIADRLVPGDAAKVDPARFIDRFLSAFELPQAVADNPAIYLHGRFSNRNGASTDDFLSPGGTAHFLALSAHQVASWRAQLYGVGDLKTQAVDPKWRSQVGTLNVAPVGLRNLYAQGLDAFDAYSMSMFSSPFAAASPEQQDTMLILAGNVVVNALPLPIPSPPAAPDAAKALYPAITIHTFQAVYGLPEYSWLDAQPAWAELNWDGDTEPRGNSIYDPNLDGDNAGYGLVEPSGGYREYRPVSTLGSGPSITGTDIAALITAMQQQAKQ